MFYKLNFLKSLKTLFITYLILSGCRLFSQENCDVIPFSSNALQSFSNSRSLVVEEELLVKIYFHVYRRNDGSGGVNQARLNQMVLNLNDFYASTPFSFYFNVCETRWVDSTFLFDRIEECLFFFQGNEHNDGIDIHIKDDNGDFRGVASEIPGGELLLSGSWSQNMPLGLSTALGHEMGHCLGLFHTHHGTCMEAGTICNGQNIEGGTIADNDFVTDTPPDPGLRGNVNEDCVWNEAEGCNPAGAPYNPLTDNFMSYTRITCRTSFTQGQIIRMKNLAWPEIFHSAPEGCCPAGHNGPELSVNSIIILCPENFVNLNSLHSGTIPPNCSIVWSTDTFPANGLDPVIDSLVFSSGTYYAYYYNSEEDCYSPSSVVIVTIECCESINTIIETNTLINNERYFGGNVIVKSGATLHIHLGSVLFHQNKGIIVESNARLVLQGSIVDVCDLGQKWAGIKIEHGGSLDTDDTYLYNASIGVDAKSGSKLAIYNLSIIGKDNQNGIGLNLEGNVDDEFISTLHISNYQYGIKAGNSNSYFGFTKGTITNTQYGISLHSSPSIIDGFHIYDSEFPIWAVTSAGLTIVNNEINYYGSSAITIYYSPLLLLQNNLISLPKQNAKSAIFLFDSGSALIQDNHYIEGRTNGIFSWASPAVISRNSIEVVGNNSNSGGGIKLIYSSNSKILDNYVYAQNSAFGIETNTCFGTEIINNLSFVYSDEANRTAAIKSSGSQGETILYNQVEGLGNATGILTQNTTSNEYICNDIISPDEGLGIYYNSEMQNIKGNRMDAFTDLAIRSQIGLQEHHGNEFVGGSARTYELEDNELDNSIFKVNPIVSYHMPIDPVPGNNQWFVSENNLNYYHCSDLSGPTWAPFNGGDPDQLCKYWNYLKSIKDTKSEMFFVKLFHLMKYAKTKKGFVIPNCIKLDPAFQILCGLTKLVDVSMALDKTASTELNLNHISSLQLEYDAQSNDDVKRGLKNQLMSELFTLKQDIVEEFAKDSSRLDSIYNELNMINCASVIVNKWKEIYKLYIKYLNSGFVESNDRNALLTYSADCSDIYGDAIHLARALANTFDDFNFDEHDGCGFMPIPRGSKVFEAAFDITVYPNPSSGIVNINLPQNFNGWATVTDVNGNEIVNDRISMGNLNSIDLSKNSGVYFIQFSSDSGQHTVRKVIIIK